MEIMDEETALVRTSGPLPFRAAVPTSALEPGGISLDREVLLRFEPSSVRIVGERPENGQGR
jgi:hypothetical protein